MTQSRWIDNFVISTRPIGPIVCPRSPVLIKTPYQGPGKQAMWEVEIAPDNHGDTPVWRSNRLVVAERIKVEENTGTFLGPLKGRTRLAASTIYFSRVRQQSDTGQWSAWSPWHQPVETEAGESP